MLSLFKTPSPLILIGLWRMASKHATLSAGLHRLLDPAKDAILMVQVAPFAHAPWPHLHVRYRAELNNNIDGS